MKENFKHGIKNPLGIIGLFLVITEAITSLVISNSSLNDMLNLLLVLFIVLFPFAVLVVFYLLVSKHHEKLYSPSDYKDESYFVGTYGYNNVTKKKEVTVLTENDNCQKDVEVNNTGMTLEDVDFLKKALLSIMDTQSQMISTQEGIRILEERRNSLEESIDDYICEKEYDFDLKVSVSKIARCKKLVSELNQKYNASIYCFGEENYGKKIDHSAIWLGDMVPIDMAVDVIRTSKSMMPHLKYILLSDGTNNEPTDVRYEIFIGGATETAIERNLYEFTDDDFNKIYQMEDIKSLHDFIYKKNKRMG